MYQVGQNVAFAISPTPSTGTQIYAYVWKLWDGTTLTTATPFTPCIEVNIGGQPGYGTLAYTVTPVQIDGQSVTLNGSITANNPPTLYPTPSISVNDGFFPFETQLEVTAFDFDRDSFSFAWFNGVTLLGSGVSSAIGNVTGTWVGNGTTVVENFAGTQNVFETTVTANETITCVITDARSGVTMLDFPLRGSDAPPPQIGVSGAVSGLVADASNLPEQRIGVGQTVTFSVYGKDPTGLQPGFLWTFAGSNNWTTGPVYTSGTISRLPDGGYQSIYVKDISKEVVAFGTEKNVIAVATVIGASSQTDVQQSLILIADTPPSAVNFVVKNFGTAIVAGSSTQVSPTYPVGTQFEFDAVAPDVDGDIVEYAWQFNQPPGQIPQVLTLWGAKIVIDTTPYPSGSTVGGIIVVTDRMGGTLVADTPFLTVV